MSGSRLSDASRVLSRFALALGVILSLAWVFYSRDQLLDQQRDSRAVVAHYERAVLAALLRPVLALQLQEYRLEAQRLSLWLPLLESDEALRKILLLALTAHHVTPEQLRLEPVDEREFFAQRKVSMAFSASAEQLWMVLDALGNSAPMKRLHTLEVIPDPDRITKLRVSLVWVVYSDRPEADDESA